MEVTSVEFILTAFLMFVRISTLIATAPFFGNGSIPVLVKVFFSITLSFMILPSVPLAGTAIPLDAGLLEVVLLIAKEMLVGVALGLVGQMLFAAVQIAGDLISLNIGLSFASIVDPISSVQQSVVSQLFMLLSLFIFVSNGGENIYLGALAQSFKVVPLGAADLVPTAKLLVSVASQLFILGIQISFPFVVVLFLMDVSFAIFARIMPQANVFFIAMPLKVGVGFVLMLWILPFFTIAVDRLMNSIYTNLDQMLQILGG